jgi:hypothetical protein
MAELHRDGAPDELRKRLRRMAWLVRGLIVIGALLTVGCTAWVWVVPGHAHSQIKEVAEVDIDQMALHTQVAGGLWTLLPVGIALLALHRLWRLFGEYAQARVFSQRALVNLRAFARCVLAMAFVSPLYGAVLSVIVTFDRKPGTRELNLQFTSGDFSMLLIGAVLVAIAGVMAEAARVAEDNAGFV